MRALGRHGRRVKMGMAAALASGSLGAGASGQSVLFIAPASAEAPVGQRVVIGAQRAQGAGMPAPEAWPAERITWMFVRSGGGQTNSEPGGPAPDVGRAGPSVALEAPDAAMVGVDLGARDEELDAKALVEWAKANIEGKALPAGFDALAAERVIVRRVESAKTLLRGRSDKEHRRGNRPTRSATATDKSGQAVEIRPMLDVTAAVTPTDMPVRMYAFDTAAKRARLRVVHVESGEEQRITSDDKAIAWVRVERPGAYRMEFHAVAPFAPAEGDGSKATWALHSATVTFTVPAPAKPVDGAEPGATPTPTPTPTPEPGKEKSR